MDESDATAGPPDYRSAEAMKHKRDAVYALGVVVAHNGLGEAAAHVEPGRGSCVFLHVWRGPGRGTAGCTGMARFELERLVGWLDPARHPVLVQLPRAEWTRVRVSWGGPGE